MMSACHLFSLQGRKLTWNYRNFTSVLKKHEAGCSVKLQENKRQLTKFEVEAASYVRQFYTPRVTIQFRTKQILDVESLIGDHCRLVSLSPIGRLFIPSNPTINLKQWLQISQFYVSMLWFLAPLINVNSVYDTRNVSYLLKKMRK